MGTTLNHHSSIDLRPLEPEDATGLHQLVKQSHPLDINSTYCNLLQCTHFRDTSVAALIDKTLVGFVSAYIPPQEPDTLFIWQLAVDESCRGAGLAKKMMNWLIARPNLKQVTRLSATVTPDNHPSCSLFESLAYEWNASINRRLLFQSDTHFAGSHKDEYELRIAPLPDRESTRDIRDHLETLKAGFHNPIAWCRFD